MLNGRAFGALLLGFTCLLVGCAQGPSESTREVEARASEPLASVSIDAMDNEAGVLTGSVRGGGEDTVVEVRDGATVLGPVEVREGRWSLRWAPREDSRTLEAVASDTSGRSARATVELQPLDFDAAQALYQPETLLRLPTSPGGTTRYTEDGSTPTPASAVYTRPLALLSQRGVPAPLSRIPTTPPDAPEDWGWAPPRVPVARASVIRFQEYRDGRPVGPVRTRTFLIGRPRYTLPVLSLATDAEHFFDFETGIYVPGTHHARSPRWDEYAGTGNYHQTGEAWERPVHVEWFEAQGQPAIAQDAGVRIHGGDSAAFPQKSLRLYARKSLGAPVFSAPFFPESTLGEFKRLVVRNSGQDLLASKIKDCTLQGLLREHTRLALQACRPTLVFLNGEYWGLQELRERHDEHSLRAHYGVDPEAVVILEGDGTLDVGKPGDEAPYRALLDFVRQHDLADGRHYAWVEQQVDVDDFIDYVAAQLYSGNQDWPHRNTKLWRTRDGRWRWLLYDLDASFDGSPEDDPLKRLLEGAAAGEETAVLLEGLLRNPGFQQRFVSRFLWHLEHTFEPQRVLAHIDARAEGVAPELPAHIDRWHYPVSMEAWRRHVRQLRDYAVRRPGHLRRVLGALPGQAQR
jgi:hypothetical protein